MGESEGAVGGHWWEDEGWWWKQLSPRHLEHRPRLPSAITLHRLVPKSTHHRTVQKASVTHFKHLKPEEIEEAQTRAKHDFMVAKLKQIESKKDLSVIEAKDSPQPKPNQVQDSDFVFASHVKKKNNKGNQIQKSDSSVPYHAKKKTTTNNKTSSQVKTRPHAPSRQGIGEENLRLRQLTRFVNQVAASLSELENSLMQDFPNKEFVTPLDNDIKQRRWEEFRRSSGRSLFSLKQEISVLERTTRPECRKKSSYLRALAVATRTLLRLVMALQSQADKTFAVALQRKVFQELVMLTYKLFPLVSSVGVRIPRLRVKSIEIQGDAVDEKSSSSSSSEISEVITVDVDSAAFTNLSQSYVRERIAFLADQHLRRKRKWKHQQQVLRSPRVHRMKVGKKITNPFPPGGDRESSINDHLENERRSLSPSKETARFHPPTASIESSYAKVDEGSRSKKVMLLKGGIKDELISSASLNNKKSHETCTGDEHQKPCEEECGSSQTSSDTQLRVIDGQELVENTADAVVARLREFIDYERKENKPETTAEEQNTGQPNTHENKPSISDVTQKIILLLQRVCKIEEDQREADAHVEKVLPKVDEESPKLHLPSAIKRAQEVMATLTTDDQHAYLPQTFTDVFSSGLPLSKDNAIIPHMSQQSEQVKVHNGTEFFSLVETRQDQDHKKDVTDVENIADQVQRQKEEFWASLVERGYLRPQVITGRGSQEVLNVVRMMTISDNGIKNGMDVDSRKEDFNEKGDKAIVVRKVQSIAHVQQKENKETQISVSLLSPDQSSQLSESVESRTSIYINESGEAETSVATSSKQSSVSEINDKSNASYSVSDECNLLKSSTPADSSKSDSFPSYSGISKS